MGLIAVAGCFFASSAVFAKQAERQRSFQPLKPTVKVVSTKLSGFGIPFNVDNQAGNFIEVQLYSSRDAGENWSFHSRQPTSATEFPFESDGEGEYWFAIKTLDRNRRLLPEGDAVAELKVVVDVTKPELGFQIESDPAGRVVCRWQAQDQALNIDSFEINYRGVSNAGLGEGDWNKVPFSLTGVARNGIWSDQVAWWPETGKQRYEVRMSITDDAGNAVSATRQVAVMGATWRRSSSSSTLDQSSPFQQRQGNAQGISQRRNQGSAQGSQQRNAERPSDNISAQVLQNQKWHRPLRAIDDPRSTPQVANRQPGSDRNPRPPRQAAQGNFNTAIDKRWHVNGGGEALPAGVELISPPLPSDWSQQDQQEVQSLLSQIAPPPPVNTHHFQPPASNADSIPWDSEVVSRQKGVNEVTATARRHAAGVLPVERPAPRSTDDIPSNPGVIVRSGSKVISESTTSWPNNQWKGPTEPIQTPSLSLAPNLPAQAGSGTENRDPDPIVVPPFLKAGFPKLSPPPAPTEPRRNPNRIQSLPSVTDNSILDGSDMPQSANTQILGTKRFELNYDINAIDPSGVGQVDLWVTRDRGRTWKLWGFDPDHQSPFPVEVIEEGLYGFRIVVRSKDGLAGRGPNSGDSADMWVLIDVTSPMVRISSVPYGRESEAGKLIINYGVSDANANLRPVHLQWSTNPDGPWTTIAKDLRNESRYVWKPTRNVPQRIFLRAEATDKAGNKGVHNLSQAIDISGLVPRGTIFGVVPVGK